MGLYNMKVVVRRGSRFKTPDCTTFVAQYPAPNTGLYEYTNRRQDVGKFRAPTLRNIAVTAPYMHDGSIATLGEVIDHYSASKRSITDRIPASAMTIRTNRQTSAASS